MTVATSEFTTLAPSSLPIPISSASRRASLLNALVEAGCEAIALAGQGVSALVASQRHDAHHDRALRSASYLIATTAQRAAVRGCGCAPALDRGVALLREARAHDAHEDGWIARALGLFERATDVLRGTNQRLETEITKRGYSRAPAE